MSVLSAIKALFESTPDAAAKAKYLDEKASTVGESLHWRTSVVDLLKLMGQDSSLKARGELARELGHKGSYAGTAEQNIWLHQQLMDHLEIR